MIPPPPAPDPACPGCGALLLVPWREVAAGEPWDSARYELLRCDGCGTAVTVGEPAGDAYETGLYSPDPPRFAAGVWALMRLALRQPVRLLRAAGVPAAGRIVDAGAGAGLLVEVLRENGLDAYGIEPSGRSLARAASARRPVLPEAVEEHTASGLDAAVLWHVLEHVPVPKAGLDRVRSWLHEDGLLLVSVPNISSLQARIAGPGWFHLDVPRHRTHFSAAGLRRLLARSGFVVVSETHFVVEHNIHGMWFALLGRLGMTAGFPFHLLKRNVPVRARDLFLLVVAGPLLLVPAVLLEAVAALARRGGTVALVAQRRS